MRPKLVLLAGIAVIVAAIAVDATSPGTPPGPAKTRVHANGGTLACAAGFSPIGRAFVHLANVGDDEARARIRIVPDEGRAVVLPVTVPAQATQSVSVHGRVPGGGAVFVEYIGSIVASHSAWLRDGAYAGSCVAAGARRLVLAHGSTVDTRTFLAIANPGRSDADVSVELLVDGQRLRPETLNKFIVPAGGRRTFSVGDFAFEAADVTSVIQANAGRVVAEALAQDDLGRTVQTAGPPLAEAVTLIGPSTGLRSVSIAAIGEDEDAAIDARILEPGKQGRATGVPPVIVPADSVRLRALQTTAAGPVAYVAGVTAGSPVGMGGSWRSGRNDPAAIEGLAPSTRWVGVIGLDQAGTARALLANPGEAPATATLTLLRPDGPERIELTIPGGRTLAHPLGSAKGAYAVVVETDRPVVLALDALTARGVNWIGVGGVARPEPEPVAVRQDPQAGVPGRRPGT